MGPHKIKLICYRIIDYLISVFYCKPLICHNIRLLRDDHSRHHNKYYMLNGIRSHSFFWGVFSRNWLSGYIQSVSCDIRLLCVCRVCHFFGVVTKLALWADSVIKSACPSVCLSVCGIAKHPSPEGVESSGQRMYSLLINIRLFRFAGQQVSNTLTT